MPFPGTRRARPSSSRSSPPWNRGAARRGRTRRPAGFMCRPPAGPLVA